MFCLQNLQRILRHDDDFILINILIKTFHSNRSRSLWISDYLNDSTEIYHWRPNAAFPISFPLWHTAGDWAGVSWQTMFCIASHKNIAASTVILSPAMSRTLVEDILTIPNTDSIKNFYATMAAVLSIWQAKICHCHIIFSVWCYLAQFHAHYLALFILFIYVFLNPSGAESVSNFGIFLNFNFPKNTFKYSKSHSQEAYRGTKPVKNYLF